MRSLTILTILLLCVICIWASSTTTKSPKQNGKGKTTLKPKPSTTLSAKDKKRRRGKNVHKVGYNPERGRKVKNTRPYNPETQSPTNPSYVPPSAYDEKTHIPKKSYFDYLKTPGAKKIIKFLDTQAKDPNVRQKVKDTLVAGWKVWVSNPNNNFHASILLLLLCYFFKRNNIGLVKRTKETLFRTTT